MLIPGGEGSSPLARGPLARDGVDIDIPGLIPARAGTTPYEAILAPLHGAHPRSRGDHVENVIAPVFTWGSSPLARGPLARLKNRVLASGLIPARAGTTC